MLTEEQKIELQKLIDECPFPKLKRFLKKSTSKYISGEIIPKKYDHGLTIENGKYVCNSKKACIIGASLIGEKAETISISCKKLFDIDEELSLIIDGFDTKITYSGLAIRDYVNKISKVIFN